MTRIPFFLVLLLAAGASGLAGCAEAQQMVRDATAAPSGGMVTTTAASWGTIATEYRGRGGTFAFDCPANPTRENAGRGVWGSGPYTYDSGVCKAGVHAGVISFERGGRVRIQMRPGQNRYAGSTRNGVESGDYSAYPESFAVVN